MAEVLDAAPGRADVLNAVGALYLNAARYDRAVEYFQAGTATDTARAELWLNLGRAHAALGRFEPARQALSRALALRPNWVPAVGALAFMDLQSGARDAAVERVVALKKSADKEASVHALEGEVRLVLREYPQAAAAFETAYAMQPSRALAAKAYQARAAGDLPSPVQPLEQWLREHPDDLPLRALLAEAYLRTGERRNAVQQYEAILARQPEHASSLNNLAWLYYICS